jgi:hypothetical protein
VVTEVQVMTRESLCKNAAVVMVCAAISVAQPTPTKSSARAKTGGTAGAASAGVAKQAIDREIAAALKDISAEHVKATIEKLVSFHTRNSNTSRDSEMAQKGQGVVAAREWIKSEFGRYSQACGGCLEVKTDSFIQPKGGRVTADTEMTNVYAVLRGTDPELSKKIYLVTGHYDSIAFAPRPATGAPDATAAPGLGPMDLSAFAPGANDDASGTAVSIECARVLSKHKFPATIVFLTVPGEEQGLDGSAHFAKVAQEEKWDLVAVLNNDIVGGDTTPGRPGQNLRVVRVFSEGVPLALADNAAEVRRIRTYGWESDSTSRELARYMAQVARTYLPPATFAPKLEFRADRFGRGGDHTSFNRYGFAAVRVTEWHENPAHQHQVVRKENGVQYGDLPEFVNFAYVANVARLNAATLAAMASAPAPPAKAIVDARGQEDPTNLSWEASPGAASYEVVWRDTTAPEWEHSKDVGNVTKVTMPYSKDNIIYGLRAVDARGHRSLVVLPKPPVQPPRDYEAPTRPRQPSGTPPQ